MDLARDFEAAVREALTQELVTWLRENDRAEQLIREAARDALVQSGYDADSVLESLVGPVIDANPPGMAVRVSWAFDHEAAQHLEFGTSEHTIEGDPVLAFEWPDAPAEVRNMFDATFPTVFFQEVTVDGVAETRFTRESLQALAAEIQR